MYCKNCGCKVDQNNKFCPKCGNKIEHNNIEKHRSRKKTWKGILFASVLFLILAGVVGIGIYKNMIDYSYLAVVRNEEGKYGYVNEKGVEIIPCQYDIAYAFNTNGLAPVGKKTGITSEGKNIYKWGFINKKDELVIPMEYDNVEKIVEVGSLLGVAKQVDTDEAGDPVLQWGYINVQGKAMTGFKYCYAISAWSKSGLCIVYDLTEKGSEYGVINKKGEEIISFGKYHNLYLSKNDSGLIAAEKQIDLDTNGEPVYKWGFIDENDNEIIPFQYDAFSYWGDNGLIPVGKAVFNDEGESVVRYGYINEKGVTVIQFLFEDADGFSNHLAYVRDKRREWNSAGYINENGELVIPYEYNWGLPFDKEGLAIVTKRIEDDNKYGMINSKGEEIVPCLYDGITEPKFYYKPLNEELNLYMVENIAEDTEEYGCIRADGTEVIPVEHDMVAVGYNGWILVGDSFEGYDNTTNKYFDLKYVDEKGEKVLELPEKYIYAEAFTRVS